MSSSSQPTSPSHRTPLTLLSKLKRQLSKSPATRRTQKQPIEHQYLPIPTVSFSSVHSNQAISTYTCSNSSGSSFVLIDHNEQPASFGVDEYRPFLPLIIQHERLQQQQHRLASPRLAPATSHRARILPPPPNEPPSPTSTASSKSPVTPNFASSFFDDDDDGIMTMSNSEVGSISEYSLPRSLSAYMDESRNVRSRRGRKSGCRTSSDSESRHRRGRGMSVRTSPRIISRRSFPPISPPPSCPLPEPPVSVKPTSTAIRPKSPLVTSDGESSSSHLGRTRSLRNGLTAPPSLPLVPALALSPAICLDAKTKAKTRPESSATILSELEIFDSPSYAFTTTPTSDEPSDQKEDGDDDDSQSTSPSTRTSVSTPTTPKQYGIGRQVLSGSGSGSDFGFIGSNSKRLSASVKRDSTGIEKKKSQLSFEPESASDSKAEKNGNVQQLDKPSADEGGSEVHQDHPTQTQTRTQTPSPTPRRRVKSDDTIPNSGAVVSRRATHHENHRESHPEWTLFLGIPRNAAPPPPPASVLFSTGESNAIPNLAPSVFSIPAPAVTQRHSLLTTHFLVPTMTMRNRTKSDSALLASASAPAPGGAEEQGDGESKVTSKTITKRGEEDWTLSLPLVVSPTSPSSASSAEVLRGSKQHSDAPSGSVSQPVVEEECQPRVGEVDTQEGLVITVEDVDKGRQKGRQVPVRRSEEGEEENQDPLILRVPRIVRSCSSYPVLSATTTTTAACSTHDIHSRLKKGSSTKWTGMGATSTPNLRRGVSSCTLEEEVMSMLLGDSATEEDDNESQLKSQPKPSKKDLAKKKMATLNEDLARFNALLKNGNQSGTGSRPVSSIIENAVAAAAAATATASPSPVMTKTKTVTLNSHPDPIPTPTTFSSPPSLRKKSTSSQTLPILKPALKQVKSCEPFLESSDGGVVHSPPLSMGPVMRFPSSTGRGDLNFFDELGGGDGHDETFKPSRASLRLTKSAEWIMGELGNDTLTALGLPAPVSASASPRASPSPPPLAQQQQRTSRSNSLLMTSTSQTPLLPFAHYNTKFASSSSSTSNLKSKGSLGRFDMSGSRGGVPTTIPFRAVSMGSMSNNTTGPFESTSGFSTSQTEKQQQQHYHQKRSPPSHLPLNTSFNSSSSSSASSLASTSPPQRHVSVSINNNNDSKRRSFSPPPPPSPASESSSTLPTPLASAFPLPPSSPRISISELDGVVAFQQKLREFENQQQQQPSRGKQRYQSYVPPSTASSFSSLASAASSTTTIVPSGDQKMRMRSMTITVGNGSGQEREREREGDVKEEDEDSMCSSTYYTARSSFSHDRCPGV